jgi:hypothetical protein
LVREGKVVVVTQQIDPVVTSWYTSQRKSTSYSGSTTVPVVVLRNARVPTPFHDPTRLEVNDASCCHRSHVAGV